MSFTRKNILRETELTTKGTVAMVASVVGAVVFIGLILASFETVQTGERGVVLRWGAYDRVLDEGFHITNPISESVKTMNVQVQKVEATAGASSKDLQTVTTVIALNYHVNPENAGLLYQQIGRDYESQVVAPAIQEAVKAGTALYTAEELVSQRQQVREAIKLDLTERLEKFNLVIDDLSIVNFEFSEQFDASIEAKQVAEQEALKAENDLRRIEVEAKQKIEQAKAEAEAIRIQAEAITQQGGEDYVNLQWIEAWKSGGAQVPQFMTGDGGNFIYSLNQ